MDMDRDALGQPYPGEDRIDTRESLFIRLGVGDINAASDAVDVSPNDLAVAHKLDAGLVTKANAIEIGLLEVPVYPKRVRINDGDLVLADSNIVAELREEIRNIAIDRGTDLGALQVYARLIQSRLRLLSLGTGGECAGAEALLLLRTGREIAQLAPALCLCLRILRVGLGLLDPGLG